MAALGKRVPVRFNKEGPGSVSLFKTSLRSWQAQWKAQNGRAGAGLEQGMAPGADPQKDGGNSPPTLKNP
jgi:hypothetical protein